MARSCGGTRLLPRVCERCGKEYHGNGARYCSRACYYSAEGKRRETKPEAPKLSRLERLTADIVREGNERRLLYASDEAARARRVAEDPIAEEARWEARRVHQPPIPPREKEEDDREFLRELWRGYGQ